MSAPRLKTKKGWLTLYGLACGYLHRYGTDSCYIKMYMVHHVIFVDVFNQYCRDMTLSRSFVRIGEARNWFKYLGGKPNET